eukprot:g17012.t1
MDKPLLASHPLAWTNYVLGCIQQLRQRGVRVPTSLDICVLGDSLQRKGLSSSAAVENAVTLAILSAVSGLNPRSATAHITNSLAQVAQVAQVGNDAENNFVNVGSGILDQGSSMFPDIAVFRYIKGELCIRSVSLPTKLTGVTSTVIDTGTEFPLASSQDIDSLPLSYLPNHYRTISLFNRRVMAFSIGRSLLSQLPLRHSKHNATSPLSKSTHRVSSPSSPTASSPPPPPPSDSLPLSCRLVPFPALSVPFPLSRPLSHPKGRLIIPVPVLDALRCHSALPARLVLFDVKYDSHSDLDPMLWSSNPCAKQVPANVLTQSPMEKAEWLATKIGMSNLLTCPPASPLSSSSSPPSSPSASPSSSGWKDLTVVMLRDEIDYARKQRRPHTLQYVVVGVVSNHTLQTLLAAGLFDKGDVEDTQLCLDVLQYSVQETRRTDLMYYLLSGHLDQHLEEVVESDKEEEEENEEGAVQRHEKTRQARRQELAGLIELHAKEQESKGLRLRASYEREIARRLADTSVALDEEQVLYTVGALGDQSWADKVSLFHGESTFGALSAVDSLLQGKPLAVENGTGAVKDREASGKGRQKEHLDRLLRDIGWEQGLAAGAPGISWLPLQTQPRLLSVPDKMEGGSFHPDHIDLVVTTPQDGSYVVWTANDNGRVI